MATGLGESLGLKNDDWEKLTQRIVKGLPYAALMKFQKTSGLPLAAIEEVIGLPRSTRARRKKEGTLKQHESDRLLRLSRLYEQALDLFHGNVEAAQHWFLTPNRALNGATPLEVSETDPGAREVERIIGCLDEGVLL